MFSRANLGDPRLHFLGLLIGLVLLFAGVFTSRDATPCPTCPGHEESAGSCLCYHVPVKTSSAQR